MGLDGLMVQLAPRPMGRRPGACNDAMPARLVDPDSYRGDARLCAMIRNYWIDRGFVDVKVWVTDGFPGVIKSNMVRGLPPKV